MYPVLWSSGTFVLYTHDVFSVVALAAGFAIYYRELRRRGMLDQDIVLISLVVVLGGAIGARTITAWENIDEMGRAFGAGAPLSSIVLHGNKSIIGGLAGGFVAGALAKRALRHRRSTGASYAPAIAAATATRRSGCFPRPLPLRAPPAL